MLKIDKLSVEVEGKQILRDINLHVRDGETVILFGPNGIGKSSLFNAILGSPKYKVSEGRIFFRGKDITNLPTSERSAMGIGMSFQRPPSIKGIKLAGLCELINSHKDDGERIKYFAEVLKVDQFLERDINLGLSGGEVKRSEIFQLILQNPLLSLIDEPESGVDIENINVLGQALKRLLNRSEPLTTRKRSGLIITHTGLILNYLNADRGYMLIDGTLSCAGNAREIFDTIQERGYRKCQQCFRNR